MDLPAASATTLVEEPATVIGTLLPPQDRSPGLDAEAEFLDTLALHLKAPSADATPVSADPGEPAGRQDLAAGGNPLPAVLDPTVEVPVEVPDTWLSEDTALVPALSQIKVAEQLPASHGSAQLFGSRLAAPDAQVAPSPAPPTANPQALTPAPVAPSPALPAAKSQAATAVSVNPSPALPAANPEAATPVPVAPSLALPSANSEAATPVPVAPSLALPSANSEAATPVPVAPSPASPTASPQAPAPAPVAPSPALPSANPQAATPVPAANPEAATLTSVARSPVSPAANPQAATPAHAATHRPPLDGPPEPVVLPLVAPVEGRGQLAATHASAQLFGPHLAAPNPPVAPSLAPTAVTPEAAAPAHTTTNRPPLGGSPELATLPAKPPSVPDGLAEPFEGRSRLSAAFDDADRGGQSSAFARASTQSPPPEPGGAFSSLARGALALAAGLHQPGWDRALGERVLWLVTQDVQRAELTLNPPELGALRVRVTVAGQTASIAFASEHGLVREAVESALPQLRQILAERGLSLEHVEVSPQESGERWTHDDRDSPPERPVRGSGRDAVVMNEAGSAHASTHRGLVDQYV